MLPASICATKACSPRSQSAAPSLDEVGDVLHTALPRGAAAVAGDISVPLPPDKPRELPVLDREFCPVDPTNAALHPPFHITHDRPSTIAHVSLRIGGGSFDEGLCNQVLRRLRIGGQ